MNRWIHPTRICQKHDVPLLITRSGVVFCPVGLDDKHEPTCIHEAPELPKQVARAIRRLRKRTRRQLRGGRTAI